jgi:hypothetical protein
MLALAVWIGWVLFALLVAGAIALGLWPAPGRSEPGLPMGERDEPRLFAALRDAALAARTPVPQLILLVGGAALSLREEGAPLALLAGRGRRVLRLGYLALESLEAGELAALLAHEMGAARARSRPQPALLALRDRLKPRPLRELPAPAQPPAAGESGPAGARDKLAAAEALFARHALSLAAAMRRAGHPCTDLYACLRAVQRALRPGDDHAAQPTRLRSLLSDPEGAARSLTAQIDAQAIARLQREGQPPRPDARALGVEQQARLAASIALHDEAVDRAQRKLPGSDELLLASLQQLEAALGPRHALLVNALANGARALARRGDLASAEQALQRALAIHAAGADPDPEETARLELLIERVREQGPRAA